MLSFPLENIGMHPKKQSQPCYKLNHCALKRWSIQLKKRSALQASLATWKGKIFLLRNSLPKQSDLLKEGSHPTGETSEALKVQPNHKDCNSNDFLTVPLIHDLTKVPEGNQKWRTRGRIRWVSDKEALQGDFLYFHELSSLLHVFSLMQGEKVWQEALLHETATPVHSWTSGTVNGCTASSGRRMITVLHCKHSRPCCA